MPTQNQQLTAAPGVSPLPESPLDFLSFRCLSGGAGGARRPYPAYGCCAADDQSESLQGHSVRRHQGSRAGFDDHALATNFKRRLKRSGHDLSKTRFTAAQLLRYFEDDLWLRNARHANSVACELADILAQVPGADLLQPVEGNIVFAVLLDAPVRALAAAGIELRSKGRLVDGRECFRLVPSFRTDPHYVRSIARLLGLPAHAGASR